MLVNENNKETVLEILYSILYYIRRPEDKQENIKKMVSSNIIKRVSEISKNGSEDYLKPISLIVKYMSSADIPLINEFFTEDYIKMIKRLLQSKNDRIIDNTLFGIYNYMTTSVEISKVFTDKFYLNRVQTICYEYKKVNIIMNCILFFQQLLDSQSRYTIETLIFEYNLIDFLFDALKYGDPSIIKTTLETIDKLLCICSVYTIGKDYPVYQFIMDNGYVTVIYELQKSKDESVFNKAKGILQDHFFEFKEDE